MKLINSFHEKLIFQRRVKKLAHHLGSQLPNKCSLLDIGCGDGLIDHLISQIKPGLKIEGIDVLIRPETFIPVKAFDGKSIPYADNSFDVVMFVDVLHHTDDPFALLQEAQRVARQAVLIKDHLKHGIFSASTLRFMDWIGNAHHGVTLPYNYWMTEQWQQAFKSLALHITYWETNLHLYPFPASLLFDRSLHFVAYLAIEE